MIFEFVKQNTKLSTSFAEGLNEEQMKSSLITIAKFHANTMTNKKESTLDWLANDTLKTLTSYFKLKYIEIKNKHSDYFTQMELESLSRLKKQIKNLYEEMKENSPINCKQLFLF